MYQRMIILEFVLKDNIYQNISMDPLTKNPKVVLRHYVPYLSIC